MSSAWVILAVVFTPVYFVALTVVSSVLINVVSSAASSWAARSNLTTKE